MRGWENFDVEAYNARQGKPIPVPEVEEDATETVEHLAVARWLNLKGIRFIHVANEGKRSRKTGALLKAMGMSPGFPDFLIFTRPIDSETADEQSPPGVVIELKRRKGGKVSNDQEEWIQVLAGLGWKTAVCRGANEAIDFLISLGY